MLKTQVPAFSPALTTAGGIGRSGVGPRSTNKQVCLWCWRTVGHCHRRFLPWSHGWGFSSNLSCLSSGSGMDCKLLTQYPFSLASLLTEPQCYWGQHVSDRKNLQERHFTSWYRWQIGSHIEHISYLLITGERKASGSLDLCWHTSPGLLVFSNFWCEKINPYIVEPIATWVFL